MPKIGDILDTQLLAKRIEEGYISMQRHPEWPLVIFNYTPKTQYEGAWDRVTSICRGLIVHSDTDQVIARPFRKFHNINTTNLAFTHAANLPRCQPEVAEKLDGSLGILYRYEDNFAVATRGSFISEQALWATEWFNRNYRRTPVWSPNTRTYLFEIIYPENRIVVKYDAPRLVLLGTVTLEDGRESQYRDLQSYAVYGIHVPQTFTKSLAECLADNQEGTKAEGYVLFYPREQIRIKVKFADYVRLHRLLTGINPVALWEIMRDGGDIDQLIADKQLPEDFKVWVKDWQAKISLDFQRHVDKIDALLAKLPIPWEPDNPAKRSEAARFIMEEAKKAPSAALYSNLAMSKLSNKPRIVNGQATNLKTWEYAVWNLVRPKNAKTFKVEEEG